MAISKIKKTMNTLSEAEKVHTDNYSISLEEQCLPSPLIHHEQYQQKTSIKAIRGREMNEVTRTTVKLSNGKRRDIYLEPEFKIALSFLIQESELDSWYAKQIEAAGEGNSVSKIRCAIVSELLAKLRQTNYGRDFN